MNHVTICGHFGEWIQGRYGPSGQLALITLAFSTSPATAPSEDSLPFTDDWAPATESGDLRRAVALASDSASRCTARRAPCDAIADLSRDLGALDMVRAHTRAARRLTFAPGTNPQYGPSALQEAGLKTILSFETGRA